MLARKHTGCDELKVTLKKFLDGKLNFSETSIFLREVPFCPPRNDDHNLEEKIKELIKCNCGKLTLSKELKDQLLHKIISDMRLLNIPAPILHSSMLFYLLHT